MATCWKRLALIALVVSACAAFAEDTEHGTILQQGVMYVSPDSSAAQVARPTRGRDTFLMGRSNIEGKPWAHIMVTMGDNSYSAPKTISGWIDGRLVITPSTPNGDQIIFGEAVNAERDADSGLRHAAEDAMRLYYRLYEYFPASPLAGEALWRAADLRWQLEKAGVFSRPSAREMSPDSRDEIDEDTMHLLMKKFPRTRWADLAAYDLLDNKVCGSWKGETRCPEKESELYERYAREHPQSPKAPEALYNAAWRQAALVDMYKSGRQREKSEKALKKAVAIAQEISTRYPEGDWKPRATYLMYALQQGIPVYEPEETTRPRR